MCHLCLGNNLRISVQDFLSDALDKSLHFARKRVQDLDLKHKYLSNMCLVGIATLRIVTMSLIFKVTTGSVQHDQ